MEGEEDHWVHLSLEEVLERDPNLVVHVVTLSQFQAAVGPTWGKIKDKAILLAEATLRKVAGHGNPIRAIGKEGVFLLTFPRLSPAEGLRRAAEAAIAVGQHLVGERFSIVGNGQAPLVCVASMTGHDLLTPAGELALDTIDTLASVAVPISEDSVIHTDSLQSRQGDTTRQAFRISSEKKDTAPEWVPLPHTSVRHQDGAMEQARLTEEQLPTWETRGTSRKEGAQAPNWEQQEQTHGTEEPNPDWERQKHTQEKSEHTFVKIQKDKRHKTTDNEWLPIRK